MYGVVASAAVEVFDFTLDVPRPELQEVEQSVKQFAHPCRLVEDVAEGLFYGIVLHCLFFDCGVVCMWAFCFFEEVVDALRVVEGVVEEEFELWDYPQLMPQFLAKRVADVA